VRYYTTAAAVLRARLTAHLRILLPTLAGDGLVAGIIAEQSGHPVIRIARTVKQDVMARPLLSSSALASLLPLVNESHANEIYILMCIY
jgi:hypothetical protein